MPNFKRKINSTTTHFKTFGFEPNFLNQFSLRKGFKTCCKIITGFTLIELLVAITILGIISSIGLTTYNHAQISSRDARRKQDIQQIKVALELYYEVNGQYPANFTDSTDPAPWIPNLEGQYINKLPIDPINNNTYKYDYIPINNLLLPTNVAISYYLTAKLENNQDPEIRSASPIIRIPAGQPGCLITTGPGCLVGFSLTNLYIQQNP